MKIRMWILRVCGCVSVFGGVLNAISGQWPYAITAICGGLYVILTSRVVTEGWTRQHEALVRRREELMR